LCAWGKFCINYETIFGGSHIETLCVECKQNLVETKKRHLCRCCYNRPRKQQKIDTTTNGHGRIYIRMTPAEVVFASTHLSQGLVFHPCTVRFLDKTSYTPDFWDPSRQAFLELSTTGGAIVSNIVATFRDGTSHAGQSTLYARPERLENRLLLRNSHHRPTKVIHTPKPCHCRT